MTWKKLPWALRFIISSVLLIAFCAALFFAGVAIYGEVVGISFAEAWANLLAACRK